MLRQADMTRRLSMVFNQRQSQVLAEVVTEAYSDLVKTGDFNELKAIVKDLAEAQKRTETRVEELAEAQKDLAAAQKDLAAAQKDLAAAQKETAEQVRFLARQLGETNSAVGGLGQSFAYALENEAYRMLPALLAEKYAIRVTERFVRTYVAGEEINLFGRGQRAGKDVLLVGETKLRLDERRQEKAGYIAAFEQLAAKAEVVKTAYPDTEIVLVLITHFARPGVLEAARERGIIVVQSFEW